MTVDSLETIEVDEAIRHGRPFGNLPEEFEWTLVKRTKTTRVFRVTWHGVFFCTCKAKKVGKDGAVWTTERTI